MTIPLVTTNRINDPQVADDILARGDADMVSMARPFLADAELLSKAQTGRTDEINTCIGCNQACLDQIFVGKSPLAWSIRAPAMKPKCRLLRQLCKRTWRLSVRVLRASPSPLMPQRAGIT